MQGYNLVRTRRDVTVPRMRRTLFDRFAGWLIARVTRRAQDFILQPNGTPYLYRWHVIPRNPILNIYLHKTVADDDQRALHDHPWWNVSVVLRGAYYEIVPADQRVTYCGGDMTAWWLRRAGDVVFRRARSPHRLVLAGGPSRHPCWSLFITGPRIRDWGFYCPQGWRSESEYRRVGQGYSEIGKGCD